MLIIYMPPVNTLLFSTKAQKFTYGHVSDQPLCKLVCVNICALPYILYFFLYYDDIIVYLDIM